MLHDVPKSDIHLRSIEIYQKSKFSYAARILTAYGVRGIYQRSHPGGDNGRVIVSLGGSHGSGEQAFLVKAVPMPVDVSVPRLPTEQLLVCKGNDVLVGDDRLAG